MISRAAKSIKWGTLLIKTGMLLTRRRDYSLKRRCLRMVRIFLECSGSKFTKNRKIYLLTDLKFQA